MKSRFNLTIEDSVLKSARLYAEKHHMSISELVEDYFKEITKPKKRETFVDIVKTLGDHHIDQKADLKELYYRDSKRGD